jgi:amino acid transporter
MAMSRDGLLPPIFSALHPKNQTPWFSTLFTGVVVAIPSLFMNLTEVTDLTSTGTLFAFALVCGGVLKLNPTHSNGSGKFRIPYINSKYIFPSLLVLFAIGFYIGSEEGMKLISNQDLGSFPLISWGMGMIFLAYFCFKKNLSLIPVLGLSTCTYLMTELGITNWLRFGIWLIVGFFIYFLYGVKHSRLRQTSASSK